MRVLPVLPVALPLVVAGILAAGTWGLPRRLVDAAAVVAASASTAASAWLLIRSDHATLTYWFGGWIPRRGISLGVAFVVDPFAAGLALAAGVLTTAALVYSWRYFDAVGSFYHVLMLVFLAAMTGFALSGDLFNMFVFFELMGVSAYALTGYKVREPAPIQGALNFGVTNSVGGFMVLVGIALVYARTGALNLAQAGRVLSGRSPDRLIVAAFALLLCGFLVKGAIVPFHFWLADAHAVAPAPVCALLSGVMVELGLYAVARIYWTVFSGAGGGVDSIRIILAVAGALTAIVGAVMCLEQRYLKRLLAFSTVSHAGMFLVGIALLTPEGLAGSALFVLEHGLAKAALFLLTGILLHRFSSVDERFLRGKGRRTPLLGVSFAAAALVLAGVPLPGASLGRAVVGEAAAALGMGWVPIVFAFASALTAGAILRAAGGIFLGWGPRAAEAVDAHHEPETSGARRRTPWVMAAPAVFLVGAGLVVGHSTGLLEMARSAGARFTDRGAYEATVLGGRVESERTATASGEPGALPDLATTIGALCVAALALFGDRWRSAAWYRAQRLARSPVGMLRGLHSGHVGDYVTWMTVGVAVLGVALSIGIK
jgi:multicomponent Na+:H+ antiporter subunit D